MDRLLLQTTRQMNAGAIGTGLISLLYLGVSALNWLAVADVIAALGGLAALYVLASVAAGRARDREAVSYSLLWGQAAMTILLLACATLAFWTRFGGQ